MAKKSILALIALFVITLPNLAAAHPVPGNPVHLHDGFDFRTLTWFALLLAVIAVFPLMSVLKNNAQKTSAKRRRR